MTKKELKIKMQSALSALWEKEESAKTDQLKRDIRCEIVGIMRFAHTLNIKGLI